VGFTVSSNEIKIVGELPLCLKLAKTWFRCFLRGQALKVFTAKQSLQLWAAAEMDLGNVLEKQAVCELDQKRQTLLAEAVTFGVCIGSGPLFIRKLARNKLS